MLNILLADVSNPLAPGLSPKSGQGAIGTFGSAIGTITGVLIVGGIVLFMIYFILSGISWITSSGDPKAVEKARGGLTHALTGLIILFSVFALLKLIGSLFGIDILNLNLEMIRLK